MAKRTGYSRSYLGNVETGERQVTPDVVRAYERVLGECDCVAGGARYAVARVVGEVVA